MSEDQTEASEPHDDAFWRFEQGTSGPPRINPVQIGLVALVAIALVIFLVGRSDDGEKVESTASAGAPEVTTTVSTGSTSRWDPALSGWPEMLGAPNIPPDQVPGDTPSGAYLWSDFNGWHLWVVSGEGLETVTAIVSTDDGLAAATAVAASGTAVSEGKQVTFTPTQGPRVAALDFEPGFYAKYVTVELTGPDGQRIDPALVHRGGSGTSPPAVPVVVSKQAA